MCRREKREGGKEEEKRVLRYYTVLYCTVLYCTVLYCTVRTEIKLLAEEQEITPSSHHLNPFFVPRYPLTQGALIVAGLLGVFVWKEIRGARGVALFFGSAAMLTAGAVLLGEFGRE